METSDTINGVCVRERENFCTLGFPIDHFYKISSVSEHHGEGRRATLIATHNFQLKNIHKSGFSPMEVAGKCVQHYVDSIVRQHMDGRDKFHLKIWNENLEYYNDNCKSVRLKLRNTPFERSSSLER